MSERSRRFIATAAILCGLVVAAFEGTVVTSAMPTIARELGGMGAYSWVFSAFLLASTVGVLACGKLADAYGRRPVFVAGMGLFLLGSALCGAANSVGALIAFRVLQGLGAGAIQPIAMTISADLYSLEERARIQALFTSAWGIANVIGPVIGGFLVEHLSWRWVFLVNVPVGIVAVALLLPSYRDPPQRSRSVEGIGAAVVAGGICALSLVGLAPGEVALEARLPMLVAASIGGAGFLIQQRRAPNPLLSKALLGTRIVRAGMTSGLFTGALLYLSAAYVPLWLTTHEHLSAVVAGGALVPLLAGWAVGSSFGVRVMVRHGMRASVAGGFAIASVGAVGLALVTGEVIPVRWLYPALALTGIGLGPAASTALVAVQSAAPWHQRGSVTSLNYAARMLGGSVAVAALGAPGFGAARFTALAAIALLAWATSARMAPKGAQVLRAAGTGSGVESTA
ncbi:MAG TPA: MFS transporter [Polyangiaceae bacterium]|jgi:MFS family permease